MNLEMLKFLVSVTGTGEDDRWDVLAEDFFKHFPQTSATAKDLNTLEVLGYIKKSDSSDLDFDFIGVNNSAHRFINKRNT